jgi:hypothetical protein
MKSFIELQTDSQRLIDEVAQEIERSRKTRAASRALRQHAPECSLRYPEWQIVRVTRLEPAPVEPVEPAAIKSPEGALDFFMTGDL